MKELLLARMHELLLTLDLISTFVFALSGATTGVIHRLDLFGVLVLSFISSTAGGITRDVLLGAVPPAAISDWRYLSSRSAMCDNTDASLANGDCSLLAQPRVILLPKQKEFKFKPPLKSKSSSSNTFRKYSSTLFHCLWVLLIHR